MCWAYHIPGAGWKDVNQDHNSNLQYLFPCYTGLLFYQGIMYLQNMHLYVDDLSRKTKFAF